MGHETEPIRDPRLAWFNEARLGLFIHFGLYSLLERGEWVMFNERIPARRYARLADAFQPAAFTPDAWATLAAEAGMKYLVFTARHHDGFCLWDSQTTAFTSTQTAARRDFVAEVLAACRRAGLRVGVYYSLMDWRFPGYFDPERHPDSRDAMVQQCHDQVRELLSNYGPIDLLWYDGVWVSHGRVKVDEAAFWRSAELHAMARRIQPHLLINNRAGTREDIDTPEQRVVASEPGRAWEACMTIGDAAGWGYVRHSPMMKTVAQILEHLIAAAAGEGNFLLNVGPQPDGAIRPEEQAILRALGRWLTVSGEAIYGSEGRLGKAPHGRWTSRGNIGYLHVLRWPGRELTVPLVGPQALEAIVLPTGQHAELTHTADGRLTLRGLPADPPDPLVTTIKVTFDGRPYPMPEPDLAGWLEAASPPDEPA